MLPGRCGWGDLMPLFGFLGFGVGLTFIYAGWLGVAPTRIVRDLFTGTPLPKRRGVLESPTAPSTTSTGNESSGVTMTPATTGTSVYPNVMGVNV